MAAKTSEVKKMLALLEKKARAEIAELEEDESLISVAGDQQQPEFVAYTFTNINEHYYRIKTFFANELRQMLADVFFYEYRRVFIKLSSNVKADSQEAKRRKRLLYLGELIKELGYEAIYGAGSMPVLTEMRRFSLRHTSLILEGIITELGAASKQVFELTGMENTTATRFLKKADILYGFWKKWYPEIRVSFAKIFNQVAAGSYLHKLIKEDASAANAQPVMALILLAPVLDKSLLEKLLIILEQEKVKLEKELKLEEVVSGLMALIMQVPGQADTGILDDLGKRLTLVMTEIKPNMPLLMQCLVEHFQKEFVTENLLFILAVRLYRVRYENASPKDKRAMFDAIYDKFIPQGVDKQINLPGEIRQALDDVKESEDTPDADVFAKAYDNIFKLSEQDTVVRLRAGLTRRVSDLLEKAVVGNSLASLPSFTELSGMKP